MLTCKSDLPSHRPKHALRSLKWSESLFTPKPSPPPSLIEARTFMVGEYFTLTYRQYSPINVVMGSPREYGLHSCRRGAVTTAVNNGCDEHTVQKQMRVASVDTVHRYASLDKKRLAKATEKLFSK